MRRLRLLALGPLLAALVAGCGQSNPALIPSTRADALNATVDEITKACDAHDTTKARAAVEAANQQVSALPRKTDATLRQNLRDWLSHIAARVDRDCKATSSATPTATPSATDTPSPSPSPSPTDTPTDTPTPTPSASATPTPSVQPPGNGGVSAPESTTP
jgi:hypothetical protein